MIRALRLCPSPAWFSGAAVSALGGGVRHLTLPRETRDGLTKPLSALKEECSGQGLDLADMCDASRSVARQLQEAAKQFPVEDSKFSGKMVTVSASVKAYTMRLSNLQNEARSIQAEVDALLKVLWGTEQMPTSGAASTAKETAEAPAEDFGVEPPAISKILEADAPPAAAPTQAPVVETVEAERVVGSTTSSTATEGGEIEVETIEVEVEEAGAASSSAEEAPKSPVDTMSITEITRDLYEREVNFSDCLDARTLRQRYKDVLDGKIPSGPSARAASAQSQQRPPQQQQQQQPRMPQPSQRAQHDYNYSQSTSSSTEKGLASDPYPNAHRKMVDPMKYVWEIKQELATEKGIDPNNVDLWSGKSKLEDHKRLYDYPSVQSYPIEVRQKGDIPH